jgi:Polysaccharide pyruvyl transferase
MILYYYKKIKNFGDALNPWIWPKLLPNMFNGSNDKIFVGIGTILNDKIPKEQEKVVFGSGYGYGEKPIIDKKWRIYCVRGPLTANALGLPGQLIVTDPAILLRTIPFKKEPKIFPFSLIPHHKSSLYWDWGVIAKNRGIHYIDPSQSVENIIRDICRSKIIIAEAMHGAIVADAFRIPWIPIKAYKHILEFKWKDWCSSMGMKYDPWRLPPLYNEDKVFSKLTKLIDKKWPNNYFISTPVYGMIKTCLRLALSKVNACVSAKVCNSLQILTKRPQAMLSSDKSFSRALERMEDRLDNLRSDISYRGMISF